LIANLGAPLVPVAELLEEAANNLIYAGDNLGGRGGPPGDDEFGRGGGGGRGGDGPIPRPHSHDESEINVSIDESDVQLIADAVSSGGDDVVQAIREGLSNIRITVNVPRQALQND
jgi:hypothetical protein